MNRRERRASAKTRRGLPSPSRSAPPGNALFVEALRHYQAGRLQDAHAVCLRIQQLNPNDVDALHLDGMIACQAGFLPAGVNLLSRAVALNEGDSALHHNLAQALAQLGRLDEAIIHYQRAVALQPNYVIALGALGNALLQREALDDAVDAYSRALALSPGQPVLANNLGTVLQRLGRNGEALAAFECAARAEPDYLAAWLNRGILLSALGRHAEAAESYGRAVALEPDDPDIHHDLGTALFADGQIKSALASYDRALALKPDHVAALGNRAVALRRLGFEETALATYDDALSIAPDHPGLLNNRGNMLRELGRYEGAARDFRRLLSVDPDYPYALGNHFHTRLYCCDWEGHQEEADQIATRTVAGTKAAAPMAFVNSPSSSEQAHFTCARTFSMDRYPTAQQPLWCGERYRHARIRLAYVSADFHNSATSQLMAGLFERHDTAQFETIAVSLGPDTNDPMRRRLQRSFGRFIDLRAHGDREAARILRELEVDIAVDLKGHTQDARLGIFAHRPAPLQVTFLGYPGTTGADFIDYIIADRVVIPPHQTAFYSEKVVYLPYTYQPNDSTRPIATSAPARRDAGLPEAGFVFCSFNSPHKINPPIFNAWMCLLRQIDGSVLWLLEDNPAVGRNLAREAEAREVDPRRLIFAPRTAPQDHLARHRLADLQLDTLPYNAHTTASESLWAGLPLVTCLGETFAGRVAASLLQAAGLPELIACSLDDYQALALKLAREPVLLAGIRSRLQANRLVCPLFDTDRHRRNLENAFETMWRRHERGEAPAAFEIAEQRRFDEAGDSRCWEHGHLG